MYQRLQTYIQGLASEQERINSERKLVLEELIAYLKESKEPKLHFICTHNSRRSHLSQIWAQTLAHYFDIEISTFSGGTEATAFNPNAVAAIERAGFRVGKEGDSNPKYEVTFSEEIDPMICYSKRFDDGPNPASGFAAIMTCSEADAECPVVFGADKRIKLFYEDPKKADGTPQEAAIYDKRCKQIATELYFVFNSLK